MKHYVQSTISNIIYLLTILFIGNYISNILILLIGIITFIIISILDIIDLIKEKQIKQMKTELDQKGTLYKGQKVSYKRFDGTYEHGIIKEIPTHTTEEVRVVYNCGGEWDKYENYTSALTRIEDLEIGWL